MWAVFGLACYTVFSVVLLARKQISLKHFGIIVLLWIIGAAPYEYLIIKNIILSGDVWATLASAAFGNLPEWQDAVLNRSISMKMVLENIGFILLNFPTPNFVLFFVGLWAIRKKTVSRSFANIVIAMLILYFVFAFRYTVVDRHIFFLPFYCLVTVLLALGADVFLTRNNRKALAGAVLAFALLPIPIYAVTPALAKRTYKALGQRRQLPYRDDYKYFLQPWKTGYWGAERFADEALKSVDENAIIWADTTTAHALLYTQQVKGKRQDVKIISTYDKSENAPVLNEDTVAVLMNDSALYVVSPLEDYCPKYLLERYDFVQAGVLWRVVKRK